MRNARSTIGLRELRLGLGGYVARAAEGERFVITVRGEEVAELVPASSGIKAIRRLAAQGKVSWSGGRPHFEKPPEVPGPPLSELVLEMREERARRLVGEKE
jgi:prevent-host-death family protein